jgi:dihydrofolate reductase
MRKLVVLSFISLDGVMQAPGGPEEDTSGDFKFGGWTVPYFDDFGGEEMGEQMSGNYDLLLGRKTYDIFASYWPNHTDGWPQVNDITKYVVSNTLKNPTWQNTVVLSGDVVKEIRKIKEQGDNDIQVHGSGNMIQTLIKNDLVDEYWLKTYPVIIGKGKKLFDSGTVPQAFKLLETKISPSGVIFAKYKRNGDVKTGSF